MGMVSRNACPQRKPCGGPIIGVAQGPLVCGQWWRSQPDQKRSIQRKPCGGRGRELAEHSILSVTSEWYLCRTSSVDLRMVLAKSAGTKVDHYERDIRVVSVSHKVSWCADSGGEASRIKNDPP